MAKMYPKSPKNTPSNYEIELFHVFEKHLGDDYTVFHSRGVQLPRKTGGVDDYEGDFVIAHPKHGVLILEVKGGAIKIDGELNIWERLKHGKWEYMDDPVEQVKGTSYALHEYLKEYEETSGFSYAIWYAVALPSVVVEGDLGSHIRVEIVLDKDKLHPSNIASSIGRLFNYYRRSNQSDEPGIAGIKALSSIIAPNHFLASRLGTDFKYEADKIKELTEQQYNLLTWIENQKRALIAGCAGSGKTMLAMEKARRLAEAEHNVLFTCYNAALSEYLEAQSPNENILVKHFHSLAYYVLDKAGQSGKWRDAMDEAQKDEARNAVLWSETIPNLMLDAADALIESDKFDAVVVDEGQDFLTEYWMPLQLLLKDPDKSIFYIFYDDAQRIYSLDDFPITGGPNAMLKQNLRSTRPIGEFISPYYPGLNEHFIPAGAPSEQGVWIINPLKYDDEAIALNHVLNRLMTQNVSLSDVAILTAASESRSQWQHKQILADGYDLRWRNKISGKRVQVSTIHGFKGLERPVIILTELYKPSSRYEDNVDKLIYVAMTRAKNLLVILGDEPKNKV